MCVCVGENQWLCEVSGQVASGEHQHKDASEHFAQQSVSTMTRWGGWERVCVGGGDIQQPAADTGAASAVTFCLRDLSASIAEKVKSQLQTWPGNEEGVGGGGW